MTLFSQNLPHPTPLQKIRTRGVSKFQPSIEVKQGLGSVLSQVRTPNAKSDIYEIRAFFNFVAPAAPTLH